MDFTKAIPTIYNGVQMRSRMETQCAVLFDRLRWKWEYEAKSYMLKNGTTYIPDFFLPEMEMIAECRGYETDRGQSQIDGFAKEMSNHEIFSYLVIGPEKCTLYKHGQKPEDAKVTYCTTCACWTFSLQGWRVGACDRCIELTFNELDLQASKGKVSLSGCTSEDWNELFFSHRLQASRFLRNLISHFYETSGCYNLARRASAIKALIGQDGSIDIDLRQCNLPVEEIAFIQRTWEGLLQREEEQRREVEEEASDGA